MNFQKIEFFSDVFTVFFGDLESVGTINPFHSSYIQNATFRACVVFNFLGQLKQNGWTKNYFVEVFSWNSIEQQFCLDKIKDL